MIIGRNLSWFYFADIECIQRGIRGLSTHSRFHYLDYILFTQSRYYMAYGECDQSTGDRINEVDLCYLHLVPEVTMTWLTAIDLLLPCIVY